MQGADAHAGQLGHTSHGHGVATAQEFLSLFIASPFDDVALLVALAPSAELRRPGTRVPGGRVRSTVFTQVSCQSR